MHDNGRCSQPGQHDAGDARRRAAAHIETVVTVAGALLTAIEGEPDQKLLTVRELRAILRDVERVAREMVAELVGAGGTG